MERHIRKILPIVIAWTILLLFSLFLMFHTFGYSSKSSSFLIAQKLWSDFGAHIPLIRSFSMGNNWPPESPLYPGEPIRYHFGFYFIVGMLERLGVRIDWALNIPSALGFFLLLFFTYRVGRALFHDAAVGVLSVFFLLFNGSLSFLRFFQTHLLSVTTPLDIWTNSRFPAFGPWDHGNITAFWTLNIYTNQRHLALSYALVLAVILLATQTPGSSRIRNRVLTGSILATLLSVLMYINYAAFGIAVLFLSWFFIVRPEARTAIVLSALLSLPPFLYLRSLVNISPLIAFYPGYLVEYPLSVYRVFRFWIENLGLYTLLIPVGFLFARREAKKLLAIPLFILFAAPNIWRFSPDMINNHKFFNFDLILGSMFAAYALKTLWSVRSGLGGLLLKGLTTLMFFFLILSGIIDLFPVLNDFKGVLVDAPANKAAAFFAKKTPPDAVVLNSYWFYHPASLAGRPIFSGYSYFTWSYGYDQVRREENQTRIFRASNVVDACRLLRLNNIAYVELSEHPEDYVQPNRELWNEEFTPVFEDPDAKIRVFDVNASCGR